MDSNTRSVTELGRIIDLKKKFFIGFWHLDWHIVEVYVTLFNATYSRRYSLISTFLILK